MSNADLIERAQPLYADSDPIIKELADALELADKRIAELAKFHAELHVEHGKAKIRIGELERKLAVAREALKKAGHTNECRARCCKGGDEWIDETKCDCCIGEALAQIGGEDAGS